MKKKEQIIGIVVAVIVAVVVAAFLMGGKKGNTNNNGDDQGNGAETTQISKGNYDVFESIKHIEIETTYEKINEVMGFEGELKDQSEEGAFLQWKKYEWQLTDDTSIEVRLDEDKTKTTAQITANFPNTMIRNDKVDFSRADEMKKKINSTEGLKYDEVVEMLGGVDGTLTKKVSGTDTYEWYNSKGGSLTVRFSTTTGKCTSFNGVF